MALCAVISVATCQSIVLTGCSTAAKHTINASIDVPVTDKHLKQITEATQRAEISATGEFASGLFFINNAPITIPQNTTFVLKLTLPIKDPSVISTKAASGSLWTSNQISIAAVPAPKMIEFKEGVVSAELDLARSMAAFIFNLIQVSNRTGEMRDLIHTVKIESLALDLRPGAMIDIGPKKIHVSKGSKVQLKDLMIDQNFNYVGRAHFDLKFAPDCKWIGEKVDCLFEGGEAKLNVVARKINDRLVLSLPKEMSDRSVLLKNCRLSFGKNKRSSTRSGSCDITLNEFVWESSQKTEHPLMQLAAAMNLNDTDLILKTDAHQTIAHFPGKVPSVLNILIKENDQSMSFATTQSARADNGTISILKKTTTVNLVLTNVTVGPVSYDKSGALNFELEGGAANLKELDWQSGNRKFSLKAGGGSTLTVPRGMLLEKKSADAKTQMKLPLKLNLGSATLKTPKGSVALADLNGDITINVGQEVQIDGSLKFAIKNATWLNGYRADVSAKRLNLEVVQGATKMNINDCSVLIPHDALQSTIKEKIPKTFTVKLNKMLKEEKTWRYRKAIANDVSVSNLTINSIKPKGKGVLSFTASASVIVKGTIEKGGLIIHKNDGWDVKPWTLTAHVTGDGVVNYKFVKRKNSTENQLDYDLKMAVPIPADVKLDWSKVASGILKAAERKVIVGKLKEITVPFDHKGEVMVFKKDDQVWKHMSISNMTVGDVPTGYKIDFSAYM